MQDVILHSVADPARDLALLGFSAFFTSGLLLWTAVRQGRTATRVAGLFGQAETTLSAVRGEMEARGRSEIGLFYFIFGSGALACSVYMNTPIPLWVLPVGLLGVSISAALFLLLQPMVSRARLRRQIRMHLRVTDFSFEDNIALAREVGALFRVEPAPEETLESYVNKVRSALGVPSPGARPFRPERRM